MADTTDLQRETSPTTERCRSDQTVWGESGPRCNAPATTVYTQRPSIYRATHAVDIPVCESCLTGLEELDADDAARGGVLVYDGVSETATCPQCGESWDQAEVLRDDRSVGPLGCCGWAGSWAYATGGDA